MCGAARSAAPSTPPAPSASSSVFAPPGRCDPSCSSSPCRAAGRRDAGRSTRPCWLPPTPGTKNERRKGRKGRKPPILRKQGPFRGRREPAETGGNWRKPSRIPKRRYTPPPHPEEHREAMRLEGGATCLVVADPSRRALRALLRVRRGGFASPDFALRDLLHHPGRHRELGLGL